MPQNDGTIMMEGVRIIFRNFRGEESQYNREGDRNFGVLIDENLASQLIDDGWNVKFLKNDDADEGEVPQAWLPVSVSWKGRAPTIIAIGDKTGHRTQLKEDDVEAMDWYDIQNVDLIVRPYNWEVNGKTGVKAYLKSIYVTYEEDQLQIKYAQQQEPE